jgi:hypothetical protein
LGYFQGEFFAKPSSHPAYTSLRLALARAILLRSVKEGFVEKFLKKIEVGEFSKNSFGNQEPT